MKKILLFSFLLSAPMVWAEIEDNSFLLEEAFNQERGVYQFIQKYQTFEKSDGMAYVFENELPITDETHQFSYEIPYLQPDEDSEKTFGDIGVNYRYQMFNKDGLLLTQRFGLILPTGSIEQGTGSGGYGFEIMQSASLRISEKFMNHWNFGLSYIPTAETEGQTKRKSLSGFAAGTSWIYLWKDNVNFLLEFLLESGQTVNLEGTKETETGLTINPGMRFALDLDWKETQIVPGISFPTELLNGPTEHGVLLYLSIEPKFF